MNDKKTEKVVKTKYLETTPTDLAISWALQNLFATYGEDVVRHSAQTLFGMNSKDKIKKSA